ncbi:MAG: aminoacyl-tRNA hydrolase [Clostridia bacterium]|nr:aminoacyl-tRNA hydrolase [Clostridia bacterium]
MIIVVGLGNPEKKYEGTYHNVGFEVIDRVAERLGVSIDKPKFKGLVGETTLDGEKVVLLKPLTYMNLSGESVVLAKNKNKDARILVIVDDIDLPKGNIRYRERGSAGTHNGLRSIVSYIGEDFQRVKVGIGRDISMDLADYVLSKFDKETFAPILDKAAQEVIDRIKA